MTSRGRTAFVVGALFGVAYFAITASGCASSVGEKCALNSDCNRGYCGSDGYCKQDCRDSALDCPPGTVCDDKAQCVPRHGGSAAGGGGSSGSGDGGSAATMSGSMSGTSSSQNTGGSSSSSSSSSSNGAGTAGTLQVLDACSDTGECEFPLVCGLMTKGESKRCTPTCSTTGECPSGLLCELIAGTKICTGNDTGRSCSEADDCNFACLENQGYCTVACGNGADCPNGYGCAGVGTPAVRVCVKVEAPCAPGDTGLCLGSALCDAKPPLIYGGCSLPCDSATDCPRRATDLPPWTCNGTICKRPGDVYGPSETGVPAQYTCNDNGNVVNLCNDTLHIDFDAFTIPGPPGITCPELDFIDGADGDVCVDSCLYKGGCSYGSACVGVGNVAGKRAGLCLPRGYGEVGEACAHDGECVFGYCFENVCSRDCTVDGICPTGSTCTNGSAPQIDNKTFRRCL